MRDLLTAECAAVTSWRCAMSELMRNLAPAILIVYAVVTSAQNIPCFVETTNHGGGLFTYTFRRGDASFVWGLGTNLHYSVGGRIEFQSYGILDVQTPPGWTYSRRLLGR